MVTLTAPYLIPLFLGMTFDARYTKPGVDIFDKQFVDQPDEVEFGSTKMEYKITESMRDVQESLNIEGDISLKIKSGMLDIAGKGAYIKNEVDFSNRIEILTTMQYISKVKSLKSTAKPYDRWAKDFSVGALGTHYVSSITYGAELIASARFVVFNTSHTQEVKGEVNAALGSGGSGNELVAEGKLENLEKKLQGRANLEISYYGTVPLKSIPNNIDGLRTLITNFKEQIDETELKEGIPMTVELTSLSTISDPEDKDKFQFLKNKNLENALKDFEEQFDEMRQARLDLTEWAKTLPYDLKPEQQREIGYLLKNITLTLQVFYDTIWSMDLTQGPKQLDVAMDTYNYDGVDVYRRFDKLVRRLKLKMKDIKWDDVQSDTYIQWGNGNCTAPKTAVLYKGFAFTSLEEGVGGSAVYSCAPKDIKPGYALAGGERRSALSGTRYTNLEKESNPFKGPFAKKLQKKGIPCAKCYSPDSASIAMFSATDSCPLSWEPMYRGYLMSSRSQRGHTTKYICVDEFPSKPFNMQPLSTDENTAALTAIKSEGSLPSKIYPNDGLVKCILCSMKSNEVNF